MKMEEHSLSNFAPDLLPKNQETFDALQTPDGARNWGFYDKIASCHHKTDLALRDIAQVSEDLKTSVQKEKKEAIRSATFADVEVLLNELNYDLENRAARLNEAINQAITPEPPGTEIAALRQENRQREIRSLFRDLSPEKQVQALQDAGQRGDIDFVNAVEMSPIPIASESALKSAKNMLITKVAQDQIRQKENAEHTLRAGRLAILTTRTRIRNRLSKV